MWWQHVLSSHYALAVKVLPDRANPRPRGGGFEMRWSGREWNVCVHYAYKPLPWHFFPPQQLRQFPKLKTQREKANAYTSELIFIMCAIEESKLLFTHESFFSAFISISKLSEMTLRKALSSEQTRTDWTRGIIAGMWLQDGIKTWRL